VPGNHRKKCTLTPVSGARMDETATDSRWRQPENGGVLTYEYAVRVPSAESAQGTLTLLFYRPTAHD